jgi:exopolysaccharide biosynthesis WecB/TagA/CpsF family protein
MLINHEFTPTTELTPAAVERALASPTRVTLLGFSLLSSSLGGAARLICDRAEDHIPTSVNFINAHCVNVASKDPIYGRALRRSDFLLPDGSGVRLAAAISGVSYEGNLNGTDLFPRLCAEAARRGLAFYFLGGHSGVAATAAAEMARRHPGLKIAGARDGYFPEAQESEVIAEINASGADILMVGMGVPRQEIWLDRNRETLAPAVTMGVGGLFDYYSGRIPRAPVAVRRVGCEWIWRLYQEPARLARCYLVGNFSFLARAVFHVLAAAIRLAGRAEGLKRALDLIVTLTALAAASPIFLAAALAIKLEDGGPVFFRQTRIGRNGRPFQMLKFRSMVVDAEKRRAALLDSSERDSVCFKMKRDPRITRAGALLRRTSMDELPQLINVLRGEMSLVGPRPALPSEVTTYRGLSWRRLAGKPGITCIWQVSGRAEIPFERQVQMDVAYLRRRSLWTDLGLLLRTIPAVLTARGAY